MAGKILVTTDGTETNKIAVNKAIELAMETGFELTAITVYNTMSKDFPIIGEENIESQNVKSFCRKALLYAEETAKARGFKIKTIMAQGTPSSVVVSLSSNYDIVICGSTGKKVLHHSVSKEISEGAKCPVLVYSDKKE